MSTSHYQPLTVLNSSHPNFLSSLLALDRLPSRFCNTVFVLHCKDGLTKPEDILASQVGAVDSVQWIDREMD